MKETLEQKLSDLYIGHIDTIADGLPAWVNAPRREWLEGLTLRGLPATKTEAWRHTDLRKILKGAERIVTKAPDRRIEGDRLPVAGYQVEVVDGFHTGEPLTALPDGVVYGSLRAAMAEREDIVRPYYNTLADNEKGIITALNSLFAQDGAFVYVPAGVKAERPFVVTFEYDAVTADLFFPRLLVVVGEGATADVIISHQQSGNGRIVADFVRETVVAQGARLNLSEVLRHGERSAVVCGNYMRQEGDSRTDMMNVWLRGGVTRVNAVTDLCGPHCQSNLYGLWLGTGNDRTDVNMRVNHLVPDCDSFELVKGVVSGEAVGAFTGMVYVARDAQRTSALQQSRNLQMSDGARIYAEPQLEIYADDVKCSHGATVGQMDTEAVFYMRQRGLSEADARRLQMFGFVNDIVSRCPHEGACDFMARLAEQRITEL